MPDDKVKREIEELLNRLDDFVPEQGQSRKERKTSAVRPSVGDDLLSQLGNISLKHVMLAAFALVVVAFLAMPVAPMLGRWIAIGGLILFVTAFALSFFNRTPSAPRVERRWRGEVIDLDSEGAGPSFRERLRAWFESKRRGSR
jgi:hypothetical protein